MDIHSGGGYPSHALSNFSPRTFVLDEVVCASMEGLVQAVKFSKTHIQIEVCKLVGKAAKARGSSRSKAWQLTQTLWWKGVPMRRDSQAYQDFLDRAFQAMCDQCEPFRRALLATGDAVLTHSMGKKKINETVLTEREFCSRLMKLRANLKALAQQQQSSFPSQKAGFRRH